MILDAPTTRFELGYGTIAVPRRTGMKMREIILESADNLYVRKWAERMVENVTDRDEWGEANAIFTFLQNHTRYAKDPRGTEFIQTPPYVLKHIELEMKPSLDCDDYTVISLSLLRSLGYPTIIRITGYKSDRKFVHVYGMVKINGRWVAFDPVRKDQDLGWEAPYKKRVMDIRI